jgi:hypothetical protein
MLRSRFSSILLLTLALAPLPFLACSSSPSDDHAEGGAKPSETGGASDGGTAPSGTGGAAQGGAGGEGGIPLSACDQMYVSFRPEGKPTFQKDVLPVLRESCTAGICHGGTPSEAQGQLWLGRPSDKELSDEETEFIYDSLVDVQAVAAPKLALVRQDRPRDSWLMLKIDSCLDHPELECVLEEDPACGERMPNIGDELPEATRALIRSWIATGAAYK